MHHLPVPTITIPDDLGLSPSQYNQIHAATTAILPIHLAYSEANLTTFSVLVALWSALLVALTLWWDSRRTEAARWIKSIPEVSSRVAYFGIVVASFVVVQYVLMMSLLFLGFVD